MALAFENEMKGNSLGMRSSTDEIQAPPQQRPITAFFPPQQSAAVDADGSALPPPATLPQFDFSSMNMAMGGMVGGMGGMGGMGDNLFGGMAAASSSGDQILQVLDRWKTDDGLIARIESKYGSSHPTFHIDSARGALARAKREFKMLMVYLHHDDHENTDLFCLYVETPPVFPLSPAYFLLTIIPL
jgi:hypothetical protein